MVKSDKEQYVRTLESVNNLCSRLMDIKEDDTRLQILTNCQEAAIALGENLENCKNSSDNSAIKENKIIKRIEDFCEQIYVCSQDFNSRNVAVLKSIISEIKILIANIPRTYRVVFLPYKASMWDSLESIWKCFAEDERCETSVVPIPYYEANRQTNQWEIRYEGQLYPKEVPVVYFQDYSIQEKRPDIVFVHNPFDSYNYVTTVDPAYYSEELKKYCSKLVYVPYYVNPGFLSSAYNQLPLLYRSDYIVLQSEKMKETCKEFPYYSRVLPLGSPKFDKVILLNNAKVAPPEEWNIDMNGKKKILLNTTIEDFLQNTEKLLEKLHCFFDRAAAVNDVVIIWRPHPLLESTVKAMRPQFVEKYEQLVDFFKESHAGVLDTTADISRAVAATDAYIGSSYSSVMALYEVCGKPVFCFDSQHIYVTDIEHKKKRANPEEVFKMKSEDDFFACRESEEYNFDDFVEDLVGERLGKVLENQRIAEAGISNNLDGTCGQKVHEYIMKDLIR